jgi:hypothetical protein
VCHSRHVVGWWAPRGARSARLSPRCCNLAVTALRRAHESLTALCVMARGSLPECHFSTVALLAQPLEVATTCKVQRQKVVLSRKKKWSNAFSTASADALSRNPEGCTCSLGRHWRRTATAQASQGLCSPLSRAPTHDVACTLNLQLFCSRTRTICPA